MPSFLWQACKGASGNGTGGGETYCHRELLLFCHHCRPETKTAHPTVQRCQFAHARTLENVEKIWLMHFPNELCLESEVANSDRGCQHSCLEPGRRIGLEKRGWPREGRQMMVLRSSNVYTFTVASRSKKKYGHFALNESGETASARLNEPLKPCL